MEDNKTGDVKETHRQGKGIIVSKQKLAVGNFASVCIRDVNDRCEQAVLDKIKTKL